MLPAGHILSCERCIGHIDDLRENLQERKRIPMEVKWKYLNGNVNGISQSGKAQI
jgi:hypothetical protein